MYGDYCAMWVGCRIVCRFVVYSFAQADTAAFCVGLQRDSGGVVLARVLCANGYWPCEEQGC